MIGGAALAGGYYRDVVAPLLVRHAGGLPHAAARLGSGSDVLGLDDDLSRDHDWGLRLTLLVDDAAVADVDDMLQRHLPDTYRGLPARFETTWDPRPHHRVEVATVAGFARSRLGLDAGGDLDTGDWLCLTGQSILEVTAGEVFHDGPGDLAARRRRLTWYPDHVWRYAVAADWSRIGEDLPSLGRTGYRDDELGSRLLAARIAATATHLAFLLHRSWPPYTKWRGTLLARLPSAAVVVPALTDVTAAQTWQARQAAVRALLALLYRQQRAAGLPAIEADDPTEPFFERPFLGIRADVVTALLAEVTDPLIRALPPGLGTVEQWIDSVPLLTDPVRRFAAARALIDLRHSPDRTRPQQPDDHSR